MDEERFIRTWKKLLILASIIAILLLSVLAIESVFGISFVPDKINVNLYPGESVTKQVKILNNCQCISNFTIKSSGICDYNDTLYLNPNEQMPFNLTFDIPKDALPGNYSCNLTVNGTFIDTSSSIFSGGCVNCGSGSIVHGYDFSRLYNSTRKEEPRKNETIIVEIPPDDIEEEIQETEVKETQPADTKRKFNGIMIMIFVILVILFIFGLISMIRYLRKKRENNKKRE